MRTHLAILAMALLGSPGTVCGQSDRLLHTEHFVQVNGVRLHYLDWGRTGEPLVLLTGYGAAADVFDSLARRFTDTFHVVALTRRGRAPSETPAAGYDLETLTSDVAGLMDALKFARVHLVAHSFGGAEATQLATKYPDRIASIVYLDAAVDAAAAEAVMKDAPIPNPQPAAGSPWALVRQWWTAYTPDFSKVRCPALALYAMQDNAPVPPNASEELRQRANEYWRTRWLPMLRQTVEKFKREAPAGRTALIRDAGHYFFREREPEVVQEMREFYAAARR